MSERFERGLAIINKLDPSRNQRAIFEDPNRPLTYFVAEHAFGDIYSREELSLRDREMITLSVLATLGCEREVRTHIINGLNAGLTEIEIAEIFLQVSIYAGFPRALSANRVLNAYLNEQKCERNTAQLAQRREEG